MPATTTAVNACGVKIELDNAAGVLTDISGSSNEATIDFKIDLGEFKVFGDAWRRRLACGKDASISLRVIYTTAADEGLDLVRDWFFSSDYKTARTCRISIPDGTNGSDSYTCEVLLESFNIPTKSDEAAPIMVAVELKPTGEVTYAVAS